MLSNAVLAGGIASCYIVILFLLLNPAVPLTSPGAARLMGTIGIAYGVHLAVTFYALIVIRQLVAPETASPAWISARLLAWFGTLAASAGAALLWLNLRGFASALDADAARRMALAAAALTGCAIGFALVAVLRYSVGRRGSGASAAACAFLLIASLALPVWARGPGRGEAPLVSRRLDVLPGPVSPSRPAPRIILIAIDGASLDFISPAVADGRLPNFGHLLDRGAVMHLATLRPTQPGPVWTAVATGKLPWRNGVRSAAMYRPPGGGAMVDLLPDYCFAHALAKFGLLAETVHTSSSVRAAPLWELLGRAGLTSHVVRWPVTWPAPPVRGAVISDLYHRSAEFMLAHDDPMTTHPRDLGVHLRRASAASSLASDVTDARPTGPYPAEIPLALDREYAALGWQLALLERSHLLALRLQGLDVAGHYYLRQALPRAFGDVSDEERRQYGRVLEQYYRYIDTEIGRALDALEPDDLLVVVSGFGMEPLSVPKRLLELALGTAAISGTHERAPDGFLMAFGTHVRPGRLPRGSVVDVAPTLLYYLGLPVGRDMDGFARTDLLARTYTESRPIAYIPTHER